MPIDVMVFFGIGVVSLAIIIISLFTAGLLESTAENDFFNIPVIFAALGGIGFTRVVVYGWNLPWIVTVLLCLGVGAGLGFSVWKIAKWLRSQNSGVVDDETMIGLPATIVSAIPVNGVGKVKVVANGHTLFLTATTREELTGDEQPYIIGMTPDHKVVIGTING